ncbi:guanosine polyphosphate pyrophosphohydrolase [Orientia tsutsugamushi]|uniref:Guanosine polyphosphate pyrophosphohydrolase n=1 Tax=Orientia tsutsugamushi TaxID=784 RepID=A0A2U3RGH2_ORITS|nr:spoT-like ppGpp hydrolase domain protein [Orientia tsutsugamushi str. UT76]SPR12326.1 guanosine polyphosphate pyrophosphohydrolase [Orientia tsutsugamushi]
MITYSTCYCKTPVSDFSQILLNKLIIINQHTQGYINLYEVTKAIKYAKKYHGKQKRDTGEPYYMHPSIISLHACMCDMKSHYSYHNVYISQIVL